MIDLIREHWNNKEDLQNDLLQIIDDQLTIAESIANAESTFDSVYLQEKEDSFKATDSEVRARARIAVGNRKTELEYRFQTYNNLIQVVTLRISQLSQLTPPGPQS